MGNTKEGLTNLFNSTKFLIVATTRPETMLGDVAVAVNPDDPRYKNLINKLVDFKVGSLGIQTSGSSAITRACRIARALTKRRLVALIGDFWHGSDDEFLFRHNYELLSDGLSISPGQNYIWFKTLESFFALRIIFLLVICRIGI